MNKNRKKNTLSPRGAYLKTRIARNRGRAQFVGIIYLLSIIALAAVACFSLFDLNKQKNAPLGILGFWKVFKPANLKSITSWDTLLKLANASIYGLMLLGCLINVCRALGKIVWLFKKKASKTYGFNRNVYAMDDLGKIFSGSYAVILTAYFLIAVLCGETHPHLFLYIALGGGLVIHLFAGFVGGKVSYFDIKDGEITEDKRVVGRGAALLRNVLQLVAVFAMLYFFQKISILHTVIGPLMEKGGIKNYVNGRILSYIPVALQLLTLVCLLPLIKHATATTEYNLDGANGPGMKTFRVFAFFVFLLVGAMVVCKYLIGEVALTKVLTFTGVEVKKALSINGIILASIALVMFIIELIMYNRPGFIKEKQKDEELEADYNNLAKDIEMKEAAPEKKKEVEVKAHPYSPYAKAEEKKMPSNPHPSSPYAK